ARGWFFRAASIPFEYIEAHITRILLELRGEAGCRHRLKGHPDLVVESNGHTSMGDAHLVSDVVPGNLLFDLLLAEGSTECGANHRSDVEAHQRHGECEDCCLWVSERRGFALKDLGHREKDTLHRPALQIEISDLGSAGIALRNIGQDRYLLVPVLRLLVELHDHTTQGHLGTLLVAERHLLFRDLTSTASTARSNVARR